MEERDGKIPKDEFEKALAEWKKSGLFKLGDAGMPQGGMDCMCCKVMYTVNVVEGTKSHSFRLRRHGHEGDEQHKALIDAITTFIEKYAIESTAKKSWLDIYKDCKYKEKIKTLAKELLDAELEEVRLKTIHKDEHPDLKKAKEAVEKLKTKVKELDKIEKEKFDLLYQVLWVVKYSDIMCSATLDDKEKEAKQNYLKGKDKFIDVWTELRIEIAKDKLSEVKEKLADVKKLYTDEHPQVKSLEAIKKRLEEISGSK